jgi:two-component system chemotaxis response regulator CheY
MKKTILVVDDSYSMRESITFFLSEMGFEILKAADGKDALTYLDGRKIDLILTDLHMPVMNGIELISNVRSTNNYKRIPILLLTTETLRQKKLEAKKAGATGWLNKPFEKEKLFNVIKKVLR